MTWPGLETLPLPVIAGLFLAAALGIWRAGTRLALLADEMSERTRIGKAIMGLVFLAAATELPEIVTTFTAALAGNAALVLNNMFGGITLQTAILVIADGFVIRQALTFYPRKPTTALEAAVLTALLVLLLAVVLIGEVDIGFHIGLGSVTLAVAYLVSIHLLHQYDQNVVWVPIEPIEMPPADTRPAKFASLGLLSKNALMIRFALASVVILVCGIALVRLSEILAVQTGLGDSFIGVTLLAGATSLPELSTTIGAVRIGSYTMAISNIFGSNLIMLVLLLPADVLYRAATILSTADKSAHFAIVSGLLVTIVYLIGLLIRHKRQFFGLGVDSIIVAITYLISLFIFYQLR
jgi:cation:H+ antiporter